MNSISFFLLFTFFSQGSTLYIISETQLGFEKSSAYTMNTRPDAMPAI